VHPLDCAHLITPSVKKLTWKYIDSIAGHGSPVYTGRAHRCTGHLITACEHAAFKSCEQGSVYFDSTHPTTPSVEELTLKYIDSILVFSQ